MRLPLEHDEGGVVFGALFRVNPQPVGKIDHAAQVVERPLGNQLVDVFKHRPEVGRGLADQLEVLHIVAQVVLACDALIRAQLVVALQNAQVDVPEKALAVAEQRVGVGQKAAHQLARGGHRGVDRNDKILDLAHLAGFERLDQRHVAVVPQAVGIIAVVERVRVDRDLFAQRGKAAQEGAVVGERLGGHGKLLTHRFAARRLV